MKKMIPALALLLTTGGDLYGAPRGSVEIGFENESVNSRYEDASFILPYFKTKTFFNETTPYYMEANYSFRYHTDRGGEGEKSKDKRQRYELFFGGYKLVNGNFAFAPKVGFRHEGFSDVEDGRANRTIYRFYPNMSYRIDEKNAFFMEGFLAYVADERTGAGRTGDSSREKDKEYSDYLHELELGHRYKLNDRQVFQSSIYSEYEKNKYDGTSEIWELRLRFNHTLENGKTTLSAFTRLPINRERRNITDKGRETEDIDRTRIGVSGVHEIDESWTVIGETWYQTQTKEDGPSQDTMFLKLAMKYSY